MFQEKVSGKFYWLPADFVFDSICFINGVVNSYIIHYSLYFFNEQKTTRDYYSPNLDTVAE